MPFGDKTFREDRIQQLIHDNPDILPIDEIESGFSPLIAIGKEVTTASGGSIDNLYISPDGYITLVETKLWRNPEARREVVGQIIDYAQQLNKWSYDDLNKSVIKYSKTYKGSSEGLIETIRGKEFIHEADEQYLIDNISRNLKRGRFLLLIVGDGIRESVEDMVEYLSQYPQLHFTLALVELQLYAFSKQTESFIIVPQVITRTKEITRAIVRIENNAAEDLQIRVDTAASEIVKQNKGGIPEDEFFEQLKTNTNPQIVAFARRILSDAENKNYFIEWSQGSFSVKMLDPSESGAKISIFVVDRKGRIYPGWSTSVFQKLGIPLDISYRFVADTAKLFKGLAVSANKNSWLKYQQLADLEPVYDKFIERVDEFARDITTAVNQESPEKEAINA